MDFLEARQITKQYAKTFYYASLFLNKEKRDAAYAIYAVCRLADQAVDFNPAADSHKRLQRIKEKIDLAYSTAPLSENILLTFRQTVNQYQIPLHYFADLLDGMKMDLNTHTYHDFNELAVYCHKVAGVIGLIMLKIFGYEKKQAEEHAKKLGIAMQLTNILRDIKEDWALGRVYLPLEEWQKFNVPVNVLEDEKLDKNFQEFLKFQIQRARAFYQESEPGIKLISNRKCRLVVCLMKEIYAGILNAIEKNGYDVFSKRAHVSFPGKVLITARTLCQGAYL